LLLELVDLMGIEPLTSGMPFTREPASKDLALRRGQLHSSARRWPVRRDRTPEGQPFAKGAGRGHPNRTPTEPALS